MPSRPPRPAAVGVTGLTALALLVLLGATWVAEQVRVARLDAADAQEVQAETVAAVRRALADELDDLARVARNTATRPAVVRALADTTGSARIRAAAFRALIAIERGADVSVEVVGPTGSLVAWQGAAFPRLAGAPPDTFTTRAVLDGAGRRALAVWQPVPGGGAVRVVRLAQAAVPVRNRYLQDYDLADAWRTHIATPFEVRISPAPGVPPDEALRGPDGAALGRVVVPRPTTRALTVRAQTPLRSLSALWASLLLACVVAGIGRWGLRVVRAADAANTRRAWLRALGALAVFDLSVVGVRVSLLALDVPVRWLDAARRPAALFDPAYFATDLGGGLLRSAGDLVLTAVAVLVIVGAGLAAALRYSAAAARSGTRSPARQALGLLGAAAAGPAAGLVVGAVAQRAVLDATLDYADRTASILDPLSLAVLAGVAAIAAAGVGLVATAVLLARSGIEAHPDADARATRAGWLAAGLAVAGAAAVGAFVDGLPIVPATALAALGGGLALLLAGHVDRWVWPLTFRGSLAGALLLAPVLFGFVRGALQDRTDATLADAARTFADTRDSRISFAVEQILAEARADDALRPALLGALAYADSVRNAGGAVRADSTRPTVDDLVAGLVSGSLLGSLVDVAAEMQVVSPAGDTLGRAAEGRGAALPPDSPLAFGPMQRAFASTDDQGFILRSEAVPGRRGESRTAAIGPLARVDGAPVAWLYVRATPRPARVATETPFPRVLAPAGLFGLDDEALAYAEYENGALVRNRGHAALRLDSAVVARLEASDGRADGVFLSGRLGGVPSRAYAQPVGGDARRVVVVRVPADQRADLLFVLLRLSLAGLAAGAVVYLVGLPVRRRLGLLPAPRTRFRDRVLNRFLAVGLASVVLTGLIGQRAIEEQNQQAVRDGLAQRLTRAEAALAPTLASGQTRLDDASAALGVDVHLYRGADLEASSRRQLVRQRLIEPRLPGAVYRALYLDGEPYAFAETQLGHGPSAFTYTTGYKSLAGPDGRPAAAVAIPTLSEQGAIEVAQARMVAYLFGGLLLLLVAIAVLAVVLAGQLTRPFGSLRAGLRAVGSGADEAPIPVETRDEVGELVETFNAMQAQLAESRRQLAAQERELAWSEMARQVAHEIKNPLMPMKLSVQHLQRTFRPPPEDATPAERDFAARFERTSAMLIDQIETLARIAGDFSAFARMPNRAPETLDVGDVAREAAVLFAASPQVTLETSFADEPLPVVADHEELRRVLVNLLTNATQAIPDGRDGHIWLATRADGDDAVIVVRDDGTGIAADVQGKVFQPSFSTKTSGTGLGLAISKRAVEAAGGRIAFETEEGVGTTFTVRLPRASPA